MKNIYIVSDVHGCYKSLLALIEQFPKIPNSQIVFVGDLVDRRKYSNDVVKFFISNLFDSLIINSLLIYFDDDGLINLINNLTININTDTIIINNVQYADAIPILP